MENKFSYAQEEAEYRLQLKRRLEKLGFTLSQELKNKINTNTLEYIEYVLLKDLR